MALFEFFKEEYGIDVWGGAEFKEIAERWRDITGDFDMIVQVDDSVMGMEKHIRTV